jgi:hypothetical protein
MDDLNTHMSAHRAFYGRSGLNQPFNYQPTSLEKLLGLVWPPKRRSIQARLGLNGLTPTEVMRLHNEAMVQVMFHSDCDRGY